MLLKNVTFHFVLALFVVQLIPYCNGNFMDFRNPTTESSNEIVVEKWIKMEDSLVEIFHKLVDRVLQRVMVNDTFPVSSRSCELALFKLIHDIRNIEDWAIRMVDSAGKPFGGQLLAFGAFGDNEMCTDLSLAPSNTTIFTDNSTSEVPSFVGQYCTLDIRPHIPNKDEVHSSFEAIEQLKDFHPETEFVADLKEKIGFMYDVPYRYGICVPSVCTRKDIISLFYSYFNQTNLIDFEINSCKLRKEFKLSIFQIIFITGASAYALMLIVVTGIDYKYYVGSEYDGTNLIGAQPEMPQTEPNDSLSKRLVKSFSMRSNMKAFFSTKMGDDRTLSCINGLRFLAMTWVLLFQSASMLSPFYIRNMNKVIYIHKSLLTQFIMNGHYAIDTFLLITSILLSYKLTQAKIRNFRVSSLIIKRIWRFMPSAILTTAIFFIMPILSESPIWDDFYNPKIKKCESFWWLPLTYAQNFLKPNSTCLPHLWYLSLDMQYFIVAIFYFLIYYKDKAMANFFILVLILSSVSSTGILSFINHLPATIAGLYPRYEQMIDQAYLFYFLPHIPLCVYAFGLFLGTYLSRSKDTKRKTPLVVLVIGWILAVAGGITCVYISYFFNNGFVPNHIETSVYNGLNRLTWAMCLSWLIYCCAIGKGGVVNDILSWPGFVILNHPSYQMYLLHYLVLAHYYTGIQGVADMGMQILYYYFLSNLVVVFICGTIMRFGFDSPMMGCGRLIVELWRNRFNRKLNIERVTRQRVEPQINQDNVVEAASNNTKISTLNLEKAEV